MLPQWQYKQAAQAHLSTLEQHHPHHHAHKQKMTNWFYEETCFLWINTHNLWFPHVTTKSDPNLRPSVLNPLGKFSQKRPVIASLSVHKGLLLPGVVKESPLINGSPHYGTHRRKQLGSDALSQQFVNWPCRPLGNSSAKFVLAPSWPWLLPQVHHSCSIHAKPKRKTSK